MSVSLKVQKSGFEFPFKRRHHVAVAWRDTILIWGGYTDGNRTHNDPKVVQYRERQSGRWIMKTAGGDYPPKSDSQHVLAAHVLNDKLYVLVSYDFVHAYSSARSSKAMDTTTCKSS